MLYNALACSTVHSDDCGGLSRETGVVSCVVAMALKIETCDAVNKPCRATHCVAALAAGRSGAAVRLPLGGRTARNPTTR
jgi:hypothetical protein